MPADTGIGAPGSSGNGCRVQELERRRFPMSEVHVRAADGPAKVWLASYPPNVPAEIPPLKHRSLGELFEDSCAIYAERPAFSSMGKTLRFSDMEVESRKVAAWLQAQGFGKGDRIAVMLPNVLQNPIIVYGILRAGMVVVNVNPLYTVRELEYQLKDSGAQAIFVLENFAHTVSQAIPKTAVSHVVVATMGDMLGLKGHIVNFVVRKVKKLVPRWSLTSRGHSRRFSRRGPACRFTRFRSAATISPSCNIRAARPAFLRARSLPIRTCFPTRSRWGCGWKARF